MQIALEVIRGRVKYPGQVKMKDTILEFGGKTTMESKPLTAQQENQLAKAKWMSRMTMKPVIKTA